MAFPGLRYERHGSRTSLALEQKSDHFKLQLQQNLYQPVFVNWYCKRGDFAAPVTLWENVCPWLWLSFCPAKKLYFDQPKLQGSDYIENEQPVSVKTNMFKIILGLGLLITNPPSRKIIVFVFSWICICPTLTKVEGVWAGRSDRNSCIGAGACDMCDILTLCDFCLLLLLTWILHLWICNFISVLGS